MVLPLFILIAIAIPMTLAPSLMSPPLCVSPSYHCHTPITPQVERLGFVNTLLCCERGVLITRLSLLNNHHLARDA